VVNGRGCKLIFALDVCRVAARALDLEKLDAAFRADVAVDAASLLVVSRCYEKCPKLTSRRQHRANSWSDGTSEYAAMV
jgi:hypothetical protein